MPVFFPHQRSIMLSTGKGLSALSAHSRSVDLSPGETHLLFALLVAAYFFSFFFRVSASVVLPSEASRLGLSAGLTGLISSFYYYAYAVMQPFSGLLHDRFGPLRIVGLGMFITGIGQVVYVLCPTTTGLALWRLMTGLGLAPMFSGALVYQSTAFAREKYALYSGLTIAAGNLGAVVSVAPLGTALDLWGHGAVFSGLSVLSLLMALVLGVFRVKDPVALQNPAAAHAPDRWKDFMARIPRTFGEILSSPFLRAVTALWSLQVAALLTLQGLWAVSWYHTAFRCSLPEARSWAMLIGVGVMAGTILAGRLSVIPGQRFSVLAFAHGACVLFWTLLLGLMGWGESLVLAGLMGFLIGVSL